MDRGVKADLVFYQNLFDKMLNGFALHELICDEDGRPCDYRFILVNPAFERLTGMKAADVLGRTVREILPGIEPSWIEIYGKVALGGQPIHFEDLAGSLGRTFEVSAYCPAKGQFAAIFADITERKRIEAQLRDSQERLELALDAANEGIWDWNPRTSERFYSPRCYTMLGYEPNEFSDAWSGLFELTHPEDQPKIQAVVDEYIAGVRESHEVEFRRRRKSGEWAWILNRGKVVAHDVNGAATRVTGTHTDLTDRKRLESQFLQAQKLESLGKLAGGVAHDFNNLLTVINGYAEMIREGVPKLDPIRDSIAEIVKAGERAAELTRQLLAFGRKQVIAPSVVDLNKVIADTERMLRRVIGEDIELTTVLDPSLQFVMADVGQIQQVFMNLAVNARDAMPDGGRLVIETANVELDEAYADSRGALKSGAYVMLAVSDTGTGMSGEVQEHLFEPFFTTKPSGAGTGLGLSTVYGIVKQSGGAIWVYSEPGKGSTFKIYLPAILEPASGAPEKPPASMLRGSETILVVEDQEDVRKLIRVILQKLGYRILEAGSPRDAEVVSAGYPARIQLMVTDVVMPLATGRDLADRLHVSRSGMKVLFISGYTDEVIAHHGIIERGVAFLPKPFSAEMLAMKVREVLDGH
jgi:two-component system, cell cycle sensor histidine kinase and response regulator CckA